MEITVERVRHALVVGRLDADGAAVLLAANLPPKRDRTFVVVGASSVDAMRRLDPWVVADLADEVCGDLCVVAPGFGSMGADGTLPPARLLADRLGVEVTAADGDPVGLADGSVFVPGPAAGWVSYRPGGRRTRLGARFPAPWWQDGLPEQDGHLTHVPVGLWLRRPGGRERPDDPLLRQVPDRDRMYVVLGAPGEPPPPETTVAEVLRSLPDEARDRAVLAWYGSSGQAGAMAGAVAAALGVPVRVAHGVPGDDGLVHVDEHGAARWRPFAVESVYRPGDASPVLDRWVAPPRLAMVEPGSFRLAPGWRVDVVARGLVVRPETVRPDPAVLTVVAAETGPTADVVFATDGPVPDDVLPALDRLVRELPADTRAALRILPADDASAAALTGIEAAAHVAAAAALPDASPREVAAVPPVGTVVVTADGRIVPAEPILAVPAPPVPYATPAVPEPRNPAPTAALDIQGGVLVVAENVDEETDMFAATTGPEVTAEGGGEMAGFAASAGPVTGAVGDSGGAAGFAGSVSGAGDGGHGEEARFMTSAGSVLSGDRGEAAGFVASAGSKTGPDGGDRGVVARFVVAAGPVLGADNGDPAEAARFVAAGGPGADGDRDGHVRPGRVVAGFAPSVGPVVDATGAAEDLAASRFASSAGPVGATVADSVVAAPPPVVPGVAAPAVVEGGERAEVSVTAGGVAAVEVRDEEESHLADLANVAGLGDQGGIPSVAAATVVPAIVPAAGAGERPVASVAGLLPRRESPPAAAAPIEVPENVRSTVTQRRAMRARLGSRYDIATRAVTRLLSERPGLRFGAGDHAALLAELAVVRVFADDPAGEYDADFYVCLADGLRRLPTARAVVVRGIPADTDLRPESVIRLPTPLVAAPVTAPEPVGPAEALIWTTTARRLDGLLDDQPPAEQDDDEEEPAPRRSPDVVLSGHTRLRVLAVAPTPVRRVLLAEDGAAPDAALTRLLAAAAVREEAVATTQTSKWFGALPAAG